MRDVSTDTNHDGTARPGAIMPADVAAITAHAEDWWECRCGNKPCYSGFDTIDRDGNDVANEPERWTEPLYRCNSCGLVVDASTTDTAARTITVIGRMAL